jgi:hypothetical protein
LHWEIAGSTGNSSKGFGGGGIGRSGGTAESGGTAASGGSRSTATPCGCGEVRERERSGGRVSLPHRGAPAVLVQRRGAAERRRSELSKHGSNGGSGSFGARVLRAEGRLRLGGEELGYGHLNRGGCGSWACGPEAACGATAPHRGRTQARVRSDCRKATGPTGGTHPSARERGKGGRAGRAG